MVREASDLLAVCAWRGVIKGYISCAATTTAELPGARAGSVALGPSERPPRAPVILGPCLRAAAASPVSSCGGTYRGRPSASEGPHWRTRVQAGRRRARPRQG